MEIGKLESIFPGASEMAHRMRSFDWSQTVLGLPETWPLNLKTCVRIILTSRQPMFIWWGEQLIHLYNDSYTAILGAKHPAALAKPAPVVWSEVWDVAGPRAEFAMHRDEAPLRKSDSCLGQHSSRISWPGDVGRGDRQERTTPLRVGLVRRTCVGAGALYR